MLLTAHPYLSKALRGQARATTPSFLTIIVMYF